MIERVTYRQWITIGGKPTLVTITKDSADFIQDFTDLFTELITHDYIAKQQS